ncbi:MAG: hypothetical protein Q9191_005025 [Dirinaria sp. TL-2023a]
MSTSQLLHSSPISSSVPSYVYAIQAVQDGNGSLAVISSDDALRIIDPHTLQLILQCAHNKVHEGVTCLSDLNGLLATGGRDKMIRCWDPRSGNRSMEFGDDEQPNSILQKGLTQDGLLNVFDISIKDEDDALVQILNHGSSIHHAGLLSDTELCAVSHDEGNLDLVPLRFTSEWILERDQSIQLLGAHGEEILWDFINEELQERTIFTGGEDGLIKAWRTPEVMEASKFDLEDSRDASRPKKISAGKSDKARFKPY